MDKINILDHAQWLPLFKTSPNRSNYALFDGKGFFFHEQTLQYYNHIKAKPHLYIARNETGYIYFGISNQQGGRWKRSHAYHLGTLAYEILGNTRKDDQNHSHWVNNWFCRPTTTWLGNEFYEIEMTAPVHIAFFTLDELIQIYPPDGTKNPTQYLRLVEQKLIEQNRNNYLLNRMHSKLPKLKCKRIALISCCAKKLDFRAPLHELYSSPRAKLSYDYARQMGVDEIRYLSAKHYVAKPEAVHAPYDLSLYDFTPNQLENWGRRCCQLLGQEFDLDNDEFIFLAGDTYTSHIAPELTHYSTPLKGLRFGEQLSRLKKGTEPQIPKKPVKLFEGINATHVKQIFPIIDAVGIPKGQDSRSCAVVYKRKKYPCKLVLSWAHLFVDETILQTSQFTTQQAVRVLTSLGYTVVRL